MGSHSESHRGRRMEAPADDLSCGAAWITALQKGCIAMAFGGAVTAIAMILIVAFWPEADPWR